ncbi:MAG: hypothetical protein FWC00_05145 [Firmicutes bacterium]|nr:hypothetical protein [Bacillota bacterium]
MRNTPRKFTKRNLLKIWGLPTDFGNENIRYPISDFDKLFVDIKEQGFNEKYDSHFAYLVKQRDMQSTPFVTMWGPQDIEPMKEKLASNDLTQYVEVWHGRGLQREDKLTWARQRIDLWGGVDLFPKIFNSCIEMWKGNSPRAIDGCPEDYVLLQRTNPAYPFEVAIHRGDKITEQTIDGAVRKLARYQKRFVDFAWFLKACGTRCMSLDIKLLKEKIVVFDWDCDNEEQVMDKIEHLG